MIESIGASSSFLPPLESIAAPLDGAKQVVPNEVKEGKSLPFSEMLQGMMVSANGKAKMADHLQEEFTAGRRDDIHGMMIASKQADIEMRLVANVRSKLVDAFHELWRMGA